MLEVCTARLVEGRDGDGEDAQERRLSIVVLTLTLFSHSNSVHMLRN